MSEIFEETPEMFARRRRQPVYEEREHATRDQDRLLSEVHERLILLYGDAIPKDFNVFVNKLEELAMTESTTSPTIGELAKALSQAQGEMTGAIKDSSNPFFKSKYADLAAVLDACREPLSKNGIAVIQTTEPVADGVLVVTTLVHESGEWIRGKLHMTPTKDDPQGIGSVITYARRYALAAIVGIAQVDDDAESGINRKPQEVKPDKFAKYPVCLEDALKLLETAAKKGLPELETAWGLLTNPQRASLQSSLPGLKKKAGEAA